ncbi:MAG: O-methyltransferase [Solirubrobacterales bacterium]|nr:O-methyltransferase [Solirubrobacterales bacterium]
MAPKSFLLDDRLHAYLLAHSTPLDDVRRRLIEETEALGGVSGMQIAPEQSLFLTLLTQLAGVRTAVEVGTFTGLSAISIAMGMPDGGHLLCCDVDESWTSVARRYWAEAGLGDRIELSLGPAIDTLRGLRQEAFIDLAFIDADKTGYIAYWEELVPRIKPGGVLLLDNVLQGGRVLDEAVDADNVVAIRAFNEHVARDPRVEAVVLPISDGLTMARRV